jgi:hypothetical protein
VGESVGTVLGARLTNFHDFDQSAAIDQFLRSQISGFSSPHTALSTSPIPLSAKRRRGATSDAKTLR